MIKLIIDKQVHGGYPSIKEAEKAALSLGIDSYEIKDEDRIWQYNLKKPTEESVSKSKKSNPPIRDE
ncbi:MAG TPA: hypothetical protein DF712_19430 [Balneola sp.]|nr:hypothetical protein [Balneola sp.]|tara:strand:- start:534 stop:734 length:201 start_codon:yes stop_codon:yes gene_type:complete